MPTPRPGNFYNQFPPGLFLKDFTRRGPKFPDAKKEYPGYTPKDLYRAYAGQTTYQYATFLTAMTKNATSDSSRQAAALMLHYLENGFATNVQQRIGQMMQQAGLDAQRVVVSEYEKNVELVRKVGSYQRPGRFAGGALKKVLESPTFFTASADGVSFGNIASLNSQAKQWARLNYGAGAKGGINKIGPGVRVRAKTVTFRDFPFISSYSSQAQNRFEGFASHVLDVGPRLGFKIPLGFWFGALGGAPSPPQFHPGGSTEMFVPYGLAFTGVSGRSAIDKARADLAAGKRNLLQRKTVTAGIAPRRFLDAGVRALYSGIERGTVDLLSDWLASADKNGPEYRRRLVEGPIALTTDIQQRAPTSSKG